MLGNRSSLGSSPLPPRLPQSNARLAAESMGTAKPQQVLPTFPVGTPRNSGPRVAQELSFTNDSCSVYCLLKIQLTLADCVLGIEVYVPRMGKPCFFRAIFQTNPGKSSFLVGSESIGFRFGLEYISIAAWLKGTCL